MAEAFSFKNAITEWDRAHPGQMMTYEAFRNVLWNSMRSWYADEQSETCKELKKYYAENEQDIREGYEKDAAFYQELKAENPQDTNLNRVFNAHLGRLYSLFTLDF